MPAAVALVVRGRRVLLTRRARPPYAGTWDLPGGFLEGDEAPDTALRRELREELDLVPARVRFLGFATDRYGPRGFPILTLVFGVTAPTARVRPSDDVSEARWFPRQRLPLGEIRFAGLRRFLRRHLAGQRSARSPGRRRRGRPAGRVGRAGRGRAA